MRLIFLFFVFGLGACTETKRNQVTDGPLATDKYGPSIRTRAGSLSELGENGVRFFAQPSFGKFHYQFDIFPKPSGCHPYLSSEDYMKVIKEKTICGAYLVKMRREKLGTGNRDPIRVDSYQFVLPEEDFRDIVTDLEERMSWWDGETKASVDGTLLSIEYVRNGKIRSMESPHRSVNNPVWQFGADIHRLALAYGPSGTIPRESGWHADITSEPSCSGLELNQPDIDGYGTGDDSCAVILKNSELLH